MPFPGAISPLPLHFPVRFYNTFGQMESHSVHRGIFFNERNGIHGKLRLFDSDSDFRSLRPSRLRKRNPGDHD